MKTHRITASPLREKQPGRLSDSTIAVARGILTAVMALTLWVGASNPVHAQPPLTGSGSHIPLGPVVEPFPVVGTPFVNNGGGNFTGTWSSPASPDWVGSFTVTGVSPNGNSIGLSTYDFSSLPLGVLPTGTWFVMGDLDNGSGSAELITFKAYDASHALITSPWFNSPALGEKDNASPGSAVLLTDMPGWNWDTSAFTYTFDGSTVPGNPAISLALGNNQAITFLDASIPNNNSFVYHIEAPSAVPEPSTVALLAGAFGALFFFIPRRSATAN